jgi:hypothetical protein
MYAELGERFKGKLLTVATQFVKIEEEALTENFWSDMAPITLDLESDTISLPYITSNAYSVLVGISPSEISEWTLAYKHDLHFSAVLKEWKGEKNWSNPLYP